MEDLVIDAPFWRGRRVLVTGHTGFKGGWLTLWLHALGADVTGLALAPPPGRNLFTSARVATACRSHLADIRDSHAVAALVSKAAPEVVFHLAAQPLVRASYETAADTWMTNVMGTVFLLDALRASPSTRSIVVVTSDKCYEQDGRGRAFQEGDALGGHDPYSSSKAATELAAASWRRSFFDGTGAGLATARAGNVIGGGDWAADRLVPDIVRATIDTTSLALRYPHATRPWQHVLDPLGGYLLLAERLFDDPRGHGGAWNFGPPATDVRTVAALADGFGRALDRGTHWHVARDALPHEAATLALDSGKSIARLGWHSRWTVDEAIRMTADAYATEVDGGDLRSKVSEQIACATPRRAELVS